MNSKSFISLKISIFVVSDTRDEKSDKSGKVLEDRIIKSGHGIVDKIFIKDERVLIKKKLSQ